MPDVQLLPSPRVSPYAGENTKALMSMMQILGQGEVARRRDFMTKNVLEAISRGAGREGISEAALMDPGFSGGIGGILQRVASPFARQAPGIEDIIAGRGIESAFETLSPSQMIAYERWNKYQTTGEDKWISPSMVNISMSPEDQGLLNQIKIDKATGKAGPSLSITETDKVRESVKKSVDNARDREWGANYTDENLFREWKKYTATYKFDNDKQRESVWNTFKNEVESRGGRGGHETDWDPEDPKWREAIGLRAETRTGDSIRMQSAPDIALDPYWENMTEEEKKTAWEHLDAGGDVEDIINLLK